MNKQKIEEITKNWDNTQLLQATDDKEGLATCLQTQYDINERDDSDAQWKRISIPLIVRIFRESEAVRRNRFCNFEEETGEPNCIIFKTKANVCHQIDGRAPSLDSEAAHVAELATNISKELDKYFEDSMNKDVVFRGFTRLNDGTLMMHYS